LSYALKGKLPAGLCLIIIGTEGLGTLRLGRSVATGNGNGLFILPGSTLSSYGDNKVDGNTIDVGGPGTLAIIANH
jgi:hypothetical protein